MDTVDDDQMEIVNENEGKSEEENEVEQKQVDESENNGVVETEEDMNIDGEGANLNEEDDEKTKDEDDEKTKEEDGEEEDEVKDIINDEEIEFYESDFDLDNLDGQDPTEIEKKKQELLEKRDKLIAFLESKGADPEELLHLGLEDQASDSSPSSISSSRQKRKRSSRRLSESPTSSYSLRDKTKRSKSVRKTPKKETIETIPDETRSSPSDNRRERTTWTLSENRQLLKILESGNSDIQYIYKEMSKLPGRRKSIGHIRNKKSNLLQKATLKGTNMIDILREDILKSEEVEGRTRRQSRDSEVYNSDSISNAPISSAELKELKNLIISGLLENQRQIALLRREFAHYRGLPTPPDVSEILSDDENDDLIQEQQQAKVSTPNSSKKTLVIKKTKQTPDKTEGEQVTAE